MHGPVEFFVQFGNHCFDRLGMFGYLGFDHLEMTRVLCAQNGLATSPRSSLQAVNAFLLKAVQPVVDDYLAATQEMGDLRGRASFALEENHLAAGAKGVTGAFAIAFFQRSALLGAQFDDFGFAHAGR